MRTRTHDDHEQSEQEPTPEPAAEATPAPEEATPPTLEERVAALEAWKARIAPVVGE